MHTLAQLKSGELQGITRLSIRENLTEFPPEIFNLADSLEILDLSGNQLNRLPKELNRLTQLKILFCSDNCFTEVPSVLATCPKLEMIGFKANQIHTFAEHALPLATRWLILTDNQLTSLPESIGALTRLQKCMLAGNQLTQLPRSIHNCRNLELLRISANQLTRLPDELFSLPKLSWLAFAGNPFCQANPPPTASQNTVNHNDIDLHELIGEGASGLIHRAKWAEQYAQPKKANGQIVEKNIAVKLFKSTVTSDGYPKDELTACLQTGKHANLVNMIAILANAPQNAEQSTQKTAEPAGMVMQLIPKKFFNLGEPPSLQSCTRDTFKPGFTLTIQSLLSLLIQVADGMAHLHQQGICHGDLYAHNILITKQDKLLLSDFGAASCLTDLPPHQQKSAIQLEINAFANLTEDLLSITQKSEAGSFLTETLKEFIVYCREERGLSFAEIREELLELQAI